MAWLVGAASGQFVIAGAVALAQARMAGHLTMLAIAREISVSRDLNPAGRKTRSRQ
jgi:hypothetical protein